MKVRSVILKLTAQGIASSDEVSTMAGTDELQCFMASGDTTGYSERVDYISRRRV